MNGSEDLYEILQVHHAAEPEVIEAAYRRLLRMYHPDVNKTSQAHDITVCLNAAYEVLRDPAKRADYDRRRSSQTHYDRSQWEWERQAEQERQARAERQRQERERRERERGAREECERREREACEERRRRAEEERDKRENMTDHEFWQQTHQKKDDSSWVGYLILWGVANVLIFLVINGLGGFLIAIIISVPVLVGGWMIYDRWQSKRMWSNIPKDKNERSS